ncbi:Protein-lysine N-methyltransferase EEF2KMT [Rhynchospora pubera]|uniref:Protein-lysine N-methyltransferase EEF2KMT n=1 Tax=Rhynchospora pubera TaxID=906938 RepID=A0AAV8FXV1_9POAL|nr:Protein-lysine N-methyltransferase EEF2KMT [Rhynchospora pubera]
MDESMSNSRRSKQLLYLKLAFLAMEPSNCILSLAIEAGGGCITPQVQNYIVNECLGETMKKTTVKDPAYIKVILKKIIAFVESSSDSVVDCLYEELAHYLTIGGGSPGNNNRIYREISFLSPDYGKDCSNSVNLVASLLCSSNMLEGDTGCSLWPSSLFLSEFILSYPEIFGNKSCFEVGSGVGLVGIALSHVRASKVTLTDGDLSSLANMKANLELNKLCFNVASDVTHPSAQKVECKHLAWELATKAEFQDQQPDVVLGADVIYNPECIPHLVRVFSIMLEDEYFGEVKREAPVAYIAIVIRNLDTFNYFLTVARESRLSVVDITSNTEVPNLLPYMCSYDRSNVHLLRVSLVSE